MKKIMIIFSSNPEKIQLISNRRMPELLLFDVRMWNFDIRTDAYGQISKNGIHIRCSILKCRMSTSELRAQPLSLQTRKLAYDIFKYYIRYPKCEGFLKGFKIIYQLAIFKMVKNLVFHLNRIKKFPSEQFEKVFSLFMWKVEIPFTVE